MRIGRPEIKQRIRFRGALRDFLRVRDINLSHQSPHPRCSLQDLRLRCGAGEAPAFDKDAGEADTTGMISKLPWSFMFAMLVCQDSKMWTMMVWIYELQSAGAPQYVILAALTLAAIPTLLIFMLAQNVIMRGIVLPSFK